MFLHLFHGRTTKDEELNGWGEDGPVLQIEGLHVTYANHVRVGVNGPYEDWFDLCFVEDLLYYDGMLYGDWSVFAKGTDPDLEARAVPFNLDKAEHAQSPGPSFGELREMVKNLADIIEAYQVHGDVNLSEWVEMARRLIGDWPEEDNT
jgi:hypothetical protein